MAAPFALTRPASVAPEVAAVDLAVAVVVGLHGSSFGATANDPQVEATEVAEAVVDMVV